jgi:hypothetical protein
MSQSRADATFVTAMSVFDDVESTSEQIAGAIVAVRVHLQGTDGASAAARSAFEYWAAAFDQVMRAANREDIKSVVRRFICSSDPRNMSKFNVAQGLMKATSHTMWRRLYDLEAGRLRSDPAEAIRDAMIPPVDRGIEFMRSIYEELAAENNESIEEMKFRIHSETLIRAGEQVP